MTRPSEAEWDAVRRLTGGMLQALGGRFVYDNTVHQLVGGKVFTIRTSPDGSIVVAFMEA